MKSQASSRSASSSRRASIGLVFPLMVISHSGLASMLTTQTGCLGPPKLEPAISQSLPRGTASSGVERGWPLLRPITVSVRFGRPAMSRMLTRPRVAFWRARSVATICGR